MSPTLPRNQGSQSRSKRGRRWVNINGSVYGLPRSKWLLSPSSSTNKEPPSRLQREGFKALVLAQEQGVSLILEGIRLSTHNSLGASHFLISSGTDGLEPIRPFCDRIVSSPFGSANNLLGWGFP